MSWCKNKTWVWKKIPRIEKLPRVVFRRENERNPNPKFLETEFSNSFFSTVVQCIGFNVLTC